MRNLLRAAILVAWVGVMMVLYERISPPPLELSPALSTDLAPEGAEIWQGVYSGTTKIGYAVRRRSVTDDGFRLDYHAVLKLLMLGAPQVVKTDVSVDTDRRLALKSFSFVVSSGTLDFEARGAVAGEVLEVTFPGEEGRTLRVPVSGAMLMPQTLHEIFETETLETGKILRYSMFDPLSAAPAVVELRVGATTSLELPDGPREVFEITQETRGSTTRLWVDRNGEVLREEGPLGLALVREDRHTATTVGFDAEGTFDIVSLAAIPVDRGIPGPRELQRLRLRLTGVPDVQSLAFPPRQRVGDDGVLSIRREEEASMRSFVLPAVAPELAPDLRATPLLQSDNPKIRDQATAILAGETDARAAAHRLLDWVYKTLEKVPTASVPSALDVLRTRQGDCNEHSVLYAALARAAGLPARVAAGAVYMRDDAGGAGAFFYHAWVEVWLGDWVAVDPTFGQFPADATHLKLLEGGPETHAGIIGLVGRLRVEVEDFS